MSSVVLNINTKFRNNYDNTESTDFIYNLPYQLKNVTSMEYLTSEFSNAPYTINNKLSTNNFVVLSADYKKMLLDKIQFTNEKQ